MLVGEVRDLFHYPIKGLSAQPLMRVDLCAGQGFPGDREYGFALHNSGFDPHDPKPLPKTHFLMRMSNAQLAELDTVFDLESKQLTVTVSGRSVLNAALDTESGRADVEAFFAQMFDLDQSESPRFVHAYPHRFTDVSVKSAEMMNAVSLINLASIDAFGKDIDADVDPARFRGNIYIDGWPPFAELEMVGQTIQLGEATARVVHRTRRCAATEVNPSTAKRDLPVPRLIREQYGHLDMGVYLEIASNGLLRPGDRVTTI